MRENIKEPQRPQKAKSKKEKKKKEYKMREGATLLSFYSTLVLVAPTLHYRDLSCFICITMWGINVIELGLYIPRMSLLK